MKEKIIVANWKMNLTLDQAKVLLTSILIQLSKSPTNKKIILAVPFVYICMVKEMIKDMDNIFLAAQNCHNKNFGAYTGEVSAAMLKSLSVDYVIIGHSERRQYFSEGDEIIKEKIDIVLENGLKVIFCCGEDLKTREQDRHTLFIQNQIESGLFNIKENNLDKILIAYEPVWAIGTGKTATNEQVQVVHSMIKKFLNLKYSEGYNITVLYGGSVNARNSKDLFNCIDVDGALVGGASLNSDEFLNIIHS